MGCMILAFFRLCLGSSFSRSWVAFGFVISGLLARHSTLALVCEGTNSLFVEICHFVTMMLSMFLIMRLLSHTISYFKQSADTCIPSSCINGAYKDQITTLPSTPVELILVTPLPLSSKLRIVLMVFWCTVLSLVSSVPDLPLRSICLNMFNALSSR
jgi:hypothetical protein